MVEAEKLSHHELEANDRSMFGFWIYLMTDLLMFGVLFAVYAVLHNSTDGGVPGSELFTLPLALAGTLFLLSSSYACGLGMLAAKQGDKKQVFYWFGITFLLGLAFLGLEIYEFTELIHEGYSWQDNAFLSSFFILVGTHGLHIICGLLWLAVTMAYTKKRGLTPSMLRKLSLLSLYWHFLDIVWIFIFTIVYLGAFV